MPFLKNNLRRFHAANRIINCTIFIDIFWYQFEYNNDYYDNHDEYFLLIKYPRILIGP